MDNETLINAVIKLGNHDEIKRVCEPDILCRQDLQYWMVKRTLIALTLFKEQWKNMEKKK